MNVDESQNRIFCMCGVSGCKNFAKVLREKMGEPKMYEDFEAMAKSQK